MKCPEMGFSEKETAINSPILKEKISLYY